MGAWRRSGVIEQFRAKLVDGMLKKGLPMEFAERLYVQLRGFGEYGFPESHAASFALLAYVSSWLKCYYPAAFTASLLNSQPMGFYAPAQLVRDARDHGVAVRPVDVNGSDWDCTLEPLPDATTVALRLGFRMVRGLPQAVAEAIVAARAERPYRSVADLARRAGVSRAALARLAVADAFGSLDLSRRPALWQVLAQHDELPLFATVNQVDPDEAERPALPALPLDQAVLTDYATTGLSLKAHPIGLIRAELERLGVTPARGLTDLNDQARVRVAGVVLMRQRPGTAKGTVFITLEDESGIVNLVLWPRVWERTRRIARGAVALLVTGTMERANGVIHVMPDAVEDLSPRVSGLATRSRDSH
jgi:error-prone DNA polymerase